VGVAVGCWVAVVLATNVGSIVASCAVGVLMMMGGADAAGRKTTMTTMTTKNTAPMLAAISAPKAVRGCCPCEGEVMNLS